MQLICFTTKHLYSATGVRLNAATVGFIHPEELHNHMTPAIN